MKKYSPVVHKNKTITYMCPYTILLANIITMSESVLVTDPYPTVICELAVEERLNTSFYTIRKTARKISGTQLTIPSYYIQPSHGIV